MGKHSNRQKRYRRVVIAAVVLGAVGVPSVAVACADWPGDGGEPTAGARPAATQNWWSDADWYRQWEAQGGASATPAPSASGTTAAPKHHPRGHRPAPGRTWHHAPRRHTTAPSTPAAPSTRTPSHSPAATRLPTSRPAAPSTPKATPSAPATTAAPSSPKPAAPASGTAARIVQLVNAERAKAGCSALTLDATLTKAAQAHSADMAAHRNMSHTGSDGSDPGGRITAAGYTWSAYGENVAYGYATPEAVMAGWMSSPGHRENILNCSFKEIGVGLAEPGDYWTQDFGTPR
ncbi:CAP domain-containing protein [Streptomyces sp. NPDC026672]|uniref:CAP domain-containing protein n=1 Tax=unclassified Streptomyces TaxID=2593676 RepID=UPI0033EF4B36